MDFMPADINSYKGERVIVLIHQLADNAPV